MGAASLVILLLSAAPPPDQAPPASEATPAPAAAVDAGEAERVRLDELAATRHKGLILGAVGFVGFGAFYGASMLKGLNENVLSKEPDEYAPLFLPLLGPFITAGHLAPESGGLFRGEALTWFLVGVGQVVFGALFVGGVATFLSGQDHRRRTRPRIAVVPTRGGAVLSLATTF